MLDAWAAEAASRARIASSRIAALLRFGGNQHLPVAIRLHRRHHAGALHVLDQARSAVVADAQMPLHQRDRRPARAQHDVDRLVVERIFFARELAVARAGGCVPDTTGSSTSARYSGAARL